MPNTILTDAAIREEISSRLGGSQLDIELDARDFQLATREALQRYSRYRPLLLWSALPATIGQKRYVLALNEHPGLQGVLDVQFITRLSNPSSFDPFNPFDTGLSTWMIGDATYGDLAQQIISMKDIRRVVSAEPEWNGFWEGAEYALYVDITSSTTVVAYRWAGAYTPDANASTGMQRVPEPDVDWLLDYIEARCMVTVGRVRRKFGGIPNPDGGVDEIDGSAMADEGKVKMDEMLAELKARTFPIPPSIE